MGCAAGKVRIGVLTKVSSRNDYSESIPHLSDAQKQAVKNNWQILKLHVANIGVIAYVSMFENRPELIDVFSKFKGKELSELQNTGLLRQHALRVMATIDKCITRIDEPSSMIYLLREVGYHHTLYNVQPDDVQIILPHFLTAIKPHIGDSWCEDLQEAWVTFLTLIFYHIREGMQPETDQTASQIAALSTRVKFYTVNNSC